MRDPRRLLATTCVLLIGLAGLACKAEPREAGADGGAPDGRPIQSAPRAERPPERHMVTVPAGSALTVAVDSSLSSATSQPGDDFTATVATPVVVDGRAVIPAGAKVHGRVTEVAAAQRGAGNARLAVTFDALRLAGGHQTPISGRIEEVSESKKGRNAAIIGGSAAGGAVLGRILGKDTKSAIIGTIVGGAIGTAIVMGRPGEQAEIPADTPFEIVLEEPIRVPHEAVS